MRFITGTLLLVFFTLEYSCLLVDMRGFNVLVEGEGRCACDLVLFTFEGCVVLVMKEKPFFR